MTTNEKHINLRIPEPSDVDILLEWENNPEYWHAGNTNIPFSRFAMEQFVLNSRNDAFSEKQIRFIIESKATQKPRNIGCADLFDLDALHRRGGVGILISKNYQKQGYANEALDLLIEYAFKKLWLQQLFAEIRQDNKESLELFLKIGFEQTGIKKAWLKTPDHYINEVFLQKLNPAYHE